MINALTIIKALLSMADWFAKYAHDKQLLEAGEYKAIARNNAEALNSIKAAQDARNGVSDDDDDIVSDIFNRDNRP
jgi:hypothetical protein